MADVWTLTVNVSVDGKATRAQIEDALTNELDGDIETIEGAVLMLVVVSARRESWARL